MSLYTSVLWLSHIDSASQGTWSKDLSSNARSLTQSSCPPAYNAVESSFGYATPSKTQDAPKRLGARLREYVYGHLLRDDPCVVARILGCSTARNHGDGWPH